MESFPETDRPTLDYYAEQAPLYVASGPGGVSRHLHGFLKRIPPRARVLELGCGAGRDSQEMLRLGYDVLATDGAPKIARAAQDRLQIPVPVMRFDQLMAVARFDAVWANASLLHVPRPALPGIVKRIWTALKPGGHHFASFKSGEQDGRDRFNRYFNYLAKDALISAYRQAGDWCNLAVIEYTGGGYETGQGPWIAITVRKSA